MSRNFIEIQDDVFVLDFVAGISLCTEGENEVAVLIHSTAQWQTYSFDREVEARSAYNKMVEAWTEWRDQREAS